MSKKLAAKSGLIQLPPLGAPAAAPPTSPLMAPLAATGTASDASRADAAPTSVSPTAIPGAPGSALPGPAGFAPLRAATRPKTAPGSMLHFMSSQSAAVKEADELRERLLRYEGSVPVLKLDPALVLPSRWANRHEATFSGPEFAALKAEIASAGGNVQPVKVRRLADAAPARYELVFGHRRHRACLELGLPVTALVEEVSDQALFVEMERENRQRKDLSAWEQGQMYARALDDGLYPSNRQLATAIGRDLGDVGKALSLARLPKTVVDAFSSPLDLQFRWAKPLNDAQQRDPEGLLARAKELKRQAGQLSPKDVFERLVAQGSSARVGAVSTAGLAIQVNGQRVGLLQRDAQGRTVMTLEAGTLPVDRQQALADVVAGFLGATG